MRIMVFLVRRRAPEILRKSKKTGRKKHWKMKRKKNEECRESQVTTINIFAFTFRIKNQFLVQKHSLNKVFYTKERLYLRWNEHHLKLMVYITSGVSFWYRPCYNNISNYDNDNKCQKSTAIYKNRFSLIVEQILRGIT